MYAIVVFSYVPLILNARGPYALGKKPVLIKKRIYAMKERKVVVTRDKRLNNGSGGQAESMRECDMQMSKIQCALSIRRNER